MLDPASPTEMLRLFEVMIRAYDCSQGVNHLQMFTEGGSMKSCQDTCQQWLLDGP